MIYFSFDQIPELASLPKAEREKISRAAAKAATKHWKFYLSFILAIGFVYLCAWIAGPGAGSIVGAFLAGAVGGFVNHLVVIHIARRHHAALLMQRDAA